MYETFLSNVMHSHSNIQHISDQHPNWPVIFLEKEMYSNSGVEAIIHCGGALIQVVGMALIINHSISLITECNISS